MDTITPNQPINPNAEPNPAPPPAKKSRGVIWVILGVILLLGGAGYFISHTSMDRTAVEAMLRQLNDRLAANGKKHGYDMRFEHAGVTMAGGIFDRRAVVAQPKLIARQIVPAGGPEITPAETTIATGEAILRPSSLRLDRVKVELAQPIDILETGKPAVQITPQTPIFIHASEGAIDNVPLHQVNIEWPQQLTVAQPEKEKSWVLNWNPGAKTDIAFTEGEGAKKNSLLMQAGNIRITGGDAQELATISTVNIDFDADEKADGELHATYKAEVRDINAVQEEPLPFAPYNLVLDMQMDGRFNAPAAAPVEGGVANEVASDATMKINNVSFSGTDMEAKLTADLNFKPGELLPAGKGNFSFINFAGILDHLRAQQKLDAKNEALLGALVQRITGKSLAESRDLSVDFERVRGGSFKIGQSSFEELMAVVLTGGRGLPMAPATASPSVDSPALETAPKTEGKPNQDRAPIKEGQVDAPMPDPTVLNPMDVTPLTGEKPPAAPPAEAPAAPVETPANDTQG